MARTYTFTQTRNARTYVFEQNGLSETHVTAAIATSETHVINRGTISSSSGIRVQAEDGAGIRAEDNTFILNEG